MLPVAEAIARIGALIAPGPIESAPLAAAAGRTLRRSVAARVAHPMEAVSAMDGYAVRAADAKAGAELRVTGTLPAGSPQRLSVGPGESVRLFTGSLVPEGATAIAIQEIAARQGDRIRLSEDVAEGRFVRRAGLDFAVGDRLLDAPRRLTPGDVALAAAMNHASLAVTRKPRIAILPTGDELVPPGGEPRPEQVIASTGIGIQALLAADGAEAALLPAAQDDPDDILRSLEAAKADLLVTLGGASVGDRDIVGTILAGRDVEVAFHGVAMRPGKPLLAGRFGATPLVGLPGNPASAMVCAHVFLRPALDALLGLGANPRPRRTARLAGRLAPGTAREHYMRARVEFDGLDAVLHPAGQQDSSVLREFAAANALAIRTPHAPAAAAGTLISYLEL